MHSGIFRLQSISNCERERLDPENMEVATENALLFSLDAEQKSDRFSNSAIELLNPEIMEVAVESLSYLV